MVSVVGARQTERCGSVCGSGDVDAYVCGCVCAVQYTALAAGNVLGKHELALAPIQQLSRELWRPLRQLFVKFLLQSI